MKEEINREYLDYRDTHLEEFKDEPRDCICWSLTLQMLQEGSITSNEVKVWQQTITNRWEQYHLDKAKALGMPPLDLEEYRWQTSFLFQSLWR